MLRLDAAIGEVFTVVGVTVLAIGSPGDDGRCRFFVHGPEDIDVDPDAIAHGDHHVPFDEHVIRYAASVFWRRPLLALRRAVGLTESIAEFSLTHGGWAPIASITNLVMGNDNRYSGCILTVSRGSCGKMISRENKSKANDQTLVFR